MKSLFLLKKLKMKHLVKILFLVFASTFFYSCGSSQKATEFTTPNKPKNIILLIGDGMGLSQVSSAYFYKREGNPNFDRFTTIGLSKTSSASDLITDSAAGATVFSTGVKTYNNAIGVAVDSTPVPTIMEHLIQRNYSTGIIATSSIQHATPASFYAHVKHRNMYEDITEFIPYSGIDFFAGGGLKYFTNRKDNRNLLEVAQKAGYTVITDKLPLKSIEGKELILLADNGMPKMSEGRGDFLPNATKLALNKLSKNEKGFFLMVEGSQIDWGGHDNDAEYLIEELLDFDKAIGVALDFAKKDGETLVIVVADHETGGFTLSADGNNYNKIKPTFTTTGHSATMVPVFAEGPGSQLFNGIYENTEVYFKMMEALENHL